MVVERHFTYPSFVSWTLVAVLFLAGNSLARPDESTSASFRIAGYLPDYRVHGVDLNATIEVLDDLYLFSLAPHSKLGSEIFSICCLHNDHFEKVRQAILHGTTIGRKIGLWVTIGGGGRSENFLEAPDTMIKALLNLTKKERLKGIDFDCEYFRNQQDFNDYQSLIVKASNILHRDGIQISVALHAGQFLSTRVYTMVDRVNLMAYDMSGTPYHADVKVAREAVDNLIKSGCPASKIFLGIPMYGRHKQQMSDAKTFAELVDSAVARGKSMAEAAKLAEIDNFLFDSTTAVSIKVQYAHKVGLGGVFFWELGQDKPHESAPAGILLSAAVSAASELTPTKRVSMEEL